MKTKRCPTVRKRDGELDLFPSTCCLVKLIQSGRATLARVNETKSERVRPLGEASRTRTHHPAYRIRRL